MYQKSCVTQYEFYKYPFKKMQIPNWLNKKSKGKYPILQKSGNV